MATYTEALAEVRRKARLEGRPVSQQEVSGVTAGFAEVASERAARAKALKLQEERDAEQKRQFEESKRQDQEQFDAQVKAERQGALAGVGGSLGTIGGFVVGGPVGAIAGGGLGTILGFITGGSHLCTEASAVMNRMDDGRLDAFHKFARYCYRNYPKTFMFYLRHGKEIVNGIANYHVVFEDYWQWWYQFERDIILPMLNADEDSVESTYAAYIQQVKDVLIPTYAPQLKKEFDVVWGEEGGAV